MNILRTANLHESPKYLKKLALLSLVLLAGLFTVLFREELINLVSLVKDREEIVAYANNLGLFGPLFIGLSIILQILVAVIPGHPLMMASGYLYGLSKGFLLSWLFIVIATQITFYVARNGGRPLVNRFMGNKETSRWEKFAKFDNVRFYILTFNLPAFPSDAMGYVAGLSNISSRRFLVANIVGRAPVPLVLAYIGTNGVNASTFSPEAIVSYVAIALVGWVLLKKAIDPSKFNEDGSHNVEK